MFSCAECDRTFGRLGNLHRHRRNVHSTARQPYARSEEQQSATPSNATTGKRSSRNACRYCKKEISRKVNLFLHEDKCEENRSGPKEKPRSDVLQTGDGNREGFILKANALNGAAREYRLEFATNATLEWMVDLHEAITKEANVLLNEIREKEGGSFKWYLTLELTFTKAIDPNISTDPAVYFNTHPVLLYLGDPLEHLQSALKTLFWKVDEYEQVGSGWVLDRLIAITVSVMKMDNPLSKKMTTA